MNRYRFKCINGNGTYIQGTIEASTMVAAAIELENRYHSTISIEKLIKESIEIKSIVLKP